MDKPCCRLRGHSAGTTLPVGCVPATIRAWRAREVQRLHTRRLVDAEDAANAIAEATGADFTQREHMIALGLDRRNQIVSLADAASEHKSMCVVNFKALFGAVFKEVDPTKVAAIIIGHNHPSGEPQASPEDIRTTKIVTCEFAGMQIIDHVIVAYDPRTHRRVYKSMREEYGENVLLPSSCREKVS